MKFSRKLSYEITKLQLSFKKPNKKFKQRILEIAPDYPQEYLKSWHQDAHKWIQGKQDSSSGPGTESLLGFLDAAKEMNYDINLIVQATKKWRKNKKREKAVQEWLLKNNIDCTSDIIYPDEISKELVEGAKKVIIVNAYERNSKARRKCIDKHGYDCFVCGFNFEKIYGTIGKKFIHVHHIKPLSEINQEYKVNPIKDLIPVCPNCHAMLHKKVPAYSENELKEIIAQKDSKLHPNYTPAN